MIITLIAMTVMPLAAQISAASGYMVSETRFDGFVRGFDILPNGNFVVLEGTDQDEFMLETTTLKEVTPDGVTVRDLYTFDSKVFGSFVRVDSFSNTIYFGESTFGSIKSIDFDRTVTQDVAMVGYHYDFAVDTSGRKFVVAANDDWTQSDVFMLGESGITKIVNYASIYCGPLALDEDGNLYYGTAGNTGGQSVIKWGSEKIANAAESDALSIENGQILASGLGMVSGIAVYGFDVYFTENGWFGPYKLMRYSNGSLSELAVGNEWLSTVRYNAATQSIYVASSQAISTLSPVSDVPEPGSIVCLSVGIIGILARASRIRIRA